MGPAPQPQAPARAIPPLTLGAPAPVCCSLLCHLRLGSVGQYPLCSRHQLRTKSRGEGTPWISRGWCTWLGCGLRVVGVQISPLRPVFPSLSPPSLGTPTTIHHRRRQGSFALPHASFGHRRLAYRGGDLGLPRACRRVVVATLGWGEILHRHWLNCLPPCHPRREAAWTRGQSRRRITLR